MGPSLGFEGRRVVVSGAASGIGRATAELIRDLGARVVALDWKPVDLPGVEYLPVDLGERASIDAAVKALGSGEIHALCNVAAVPSGCGLPPERIVAINYVGTRHLTEALVPHIGRGGAIVCVSSGAARGWREKAALLRPLVAAEGFDGALAWLKDHAPLPDPYPFSKEAINWWTRLAVPDLTRRHGIRLNVVAPGLVDTQQPRQSTVGSYEQLVAGFTRYVERIGQPRELAWPIAFLASPASAFVNGQLMEVDGGMLTIAGVEQGLG